MNEITIKGLKVAACHGVLPSEKDNPQPFVFDAVLGLDTDAAADSDSVSDTVDYAGVCALLNSFCKDNSFNLIERLAQGAAFIIMEKHPALRYARVTVHKPQAPVGLPVEDIAVTVTVERNTVLLSLGASLSDKKAALDGAIDCLKDIRGVTVTRVSDYMESEPYGGVARNTFLNCAVAAECLLSPRTLLKEIHSIEEKFGRKRTVRWEDRTLDIDIIFFGNKIIEEEGLTIPHSDYKSRGFVLAPLKQIAPYFTCPLTHKKIIEF